MGESKHPIPANKFATLPWRNCTRTEGRDSREAAGLGPREHHFIGDRLFDAN